MTWRLGVCVALAAGAVGAAWEAWADIASTAVNHPESGYILLAPLVAVVLAATRVADVRRGRPTAGWVGVGLIAVGWVAWRWGFWNGFWLPWHVGAVAAMVGGVVVGLGGRAAARLAPALAVAAFLVPTTGVGPKYVGRPLQGGTVAAAHAACTALGMDVERAGNVLTLPDGTAVAVAEACNGLRLVAALWLATYFAAFARPGRWWVRAVVLASAPAVAVGANVVRLVPTVWMFGRGDADAAARFHDGAGWGMLVVAFGVTLGIARACEWVADGAAGRRRGHRDAKRSAAPKPATPRTPAVATAGPARGWWAAAAVAAVLLVGMVADAALMPGLSASGAYHRQVAQVAAAADDAAAAAAAAAGPAGEWTWEPMPVSREAVALLRPNVAISRRYEHRTTGLRVRFMLTQVRDARACVDHFNPLCFTLAGWTETGREPAEWRVGDLTLRGAAATYTGGPRRRPTGPRDGIAAVDAEATTAYLLILPDGRSSADVDALTDRLTTLPDRHAGAAQVQFVFDGTPTAAERDAAVADILSLHGPLLRLLTAGPRGSVP